MSNLLYISIAYYMQKWGQGVQIACKNAYVINGRPLNLVNNKWRRLVLNGRITFTKLELVPAFLFIKPATKRDLLVNPIAAGTC